MPGSARCRTSRMSSRPLSRNVPPGRSRPHPRRGRRPREVLRRRRRSRRPTSARSGKRCSTSPAPPTMPNAATTTRCMRPWRRASCSTGPSRNGPRHTRPRATRMPQPSRRGASSGGWSAPDLWMPPDVRAAGPSDCSRMADLPPQQYVVRKPSGDPTAARQLASAYDTCADALLAELRVVTHVFVQLGPTWRGGGAQAAHTPEQVLAEDCMRVAHALRQSASDLRHYAHKLERAHEHHGWSLGRLVTLGAIVTVGVAAVVVTVGAAAPAEAAAAAAAGGDAGGGAAAPRAGGAAP